VPSTKSASLLQLRLRKFRRIKRGYYSFLVLACAYLATFFLPFLMNNRAIVVLHEGSWHFPAFRSYIHDVTGIGSSHIVQAQTLGQSEAGGRSVSGDAEALYRHLKKQYAADAAIIESLSPLAKKRLFGEDLSAEETKILKQDEKNLHEEQAQDNLKRLEAPISPIARSFVTNQLYTSTDKNRYYEELNELRPEKRVETERDHAALKKLCSESSLAVQKLTTGDLTSEEQTQLSQQLLEDKTPLETALDKGLNRYTLDNFVLMPPLDYSPYEKVENVSRAPAHPSWPHIMGTDAGGRDVFIRMTYAFRLSITLALIVVGVAYTFGTLTGALLGYYGRWIDILGLRLVEIWSAVPFLYTVMILAQIFGRSFTMLCGILAAFGWMSITYYIRGEFYREKSRDYVAAALATGESDLSIIFKHILPNALTPIITYAPFATVATISSLVALDYLGFGLPPSEPSWGQLLRQAREESLNDWHLIVFPLGAMFITLQLIVFIGEAVREAFDPKVFSRLR